jgi:hypothetical protein
VRGHSPLAPSSAARRRQCTASTRAEQQYPQTEQSPAAIEGSAAHWGASEALSGRVIAEGQITPVGPYLTAEMIEAIDVYVDDVQSVVALTDVIVERPVMIHRIHPLSWGTPDARAWFPARKRLVLWDFKFGFRPVEAFENPQCVEYVAGCLDELGIDPADPTVLVEIRIVQPRAHHRDGPVRSWTTRAVDLLPHIAAASAAAYEALGPSPTYRVGPECRDCAARHACTTLQAAALTACDVAGKAQPFDLPPDALALEYRTLKRHASLLSARLSGLEEQALSLGRRGTPLPGLRIEHGAGRERWTVPDDVVIAMGQVLGVQLGKPPAAITPKQALKAGLPEAAITGLVDTPRGEAKLVEDDGTMARRVFG